MTLCYLHQHSPAELLYRWEHSLSAFSNIGTIYVRLLSISIATNASKPIYLKFK